MELFTIGLRMALCLEAELFTIGGALNNRALHGGLPHRAEDAALGVGAPQDRAQQFSSVLWLLQVFKVFNKMGHLHGRGQRQVAPMPASWEPSGGGSGGKTELPTLPNRASALEFVDWLYLCGPIMQNLSHVAERWWHATVRQAHAFYLEWKGLSPLQRVQLCPRLPGELLESCLTRTEQ